jgi:hypothetical protein
MQFTPGKITVKWYRRNYKNKKLSITFEWLIQLTASWDYRGF